MIFFCLRLQYLNLLVDHAEETLNSSIEDAVQRSVLSVLHLFDEMNHRFEHVGDILVGGRTNNMIPSAAADPIRCKGQLNEW